MQVMCAGCKQPIELVDPGTPTFVNLPASSLIVLEHPKQGFCLNCKTAVSVAILRCNFCWSPRQCRRRPRSG